MKKIILSAFVCISVAVYAQPVEIYLMRENVQTVIQSTGLIVSEPLILETYNQKPDVEEASDQPTEETQSSFGNLGIGIETVVSPKSMYVPVPIRYSVKDFGLAVSLPYFYYRAMEYSHGTVATTGMGDVLAGVSYKKKTDNMAAEVLLNVKLPTGDENKMVDGYLVPLGTGSTDLGLSGSFAYAVNKLVFNGLFSFRLAGITSRMVEVTYAPTDVELIDYKIQNGGNLIVNAGARYKMYKNLNLIGNLSLMSNGEGKLDRKHTRNGAEIYSFTGLSANQNFTFVDFQLGASYTLYKIDALLSLNLPLYTQRNLASIESDRGLGFFFRLSRTINFF